MEFRQVKNEFAKIARYFPVFLGAAGGFLYYNFIGCVTGSCAITSNPWSSMLLGALVGSVFVKKRKNPEEKKVNQ